MKSLLNYIGKKDELDVYTYINKCNNVNIYCEPFAGGFSAGLNLIEKGFKGKVVLNDLDWKVYNFWIILRDNWEELFSCINNILNEMSQYEHKDERLHILKKYKNCSDNINKAAVEYIYRKLLTTNGISSSFKQFKDSEIDFYLQSRTLRNVEITNVDYKEVIQKYDNKNTFFMIDPPYYVDGVDRYYRCNSGFFYHKELRDIVIKLKSNFLLTYNNDEYIKELYDNNGLYLEYVEKWFGHLYYELFWNNIMEYDGLEHIICRNEQEEINKYIDFKDLFRELE